MRKLPIRAAVALVLGAAVAVPSIPAPASAALAVQQDSEEEARRRSRLSLSSSTARVLQDVFNDIESDNPQAALQKLNRLLGNELSAFDESTALQLRGQVNFQLDDRAGALRDFERILQIDELPFERLKQIRYTVAQLHYGEGNYSRAASIMEDYLQDPTNQADANAWFILAGAYYAQDQFQQARSPAEQALERAPNPDKKYFDLLNIIYSELGLMEPRAALLERMVQLFPSEENYWTQLSFVYDRMGRGQDALAVLESAYNAGIIEGEDKIIALAQYYASQENYFRGGELIAQEMAAGVVERDLRNLELLAQLWSQAREQERAIEALTDAAALAETGALYYRLGQSYVANEEYEEGVANLRRALNRGGLSAREQGDIWILIGTSYFSLDRETAEGRRRARDAFQNATRFSSSRSTAQGWVEYINAIENTIRRQNEVERIQRQEAARREVERCETLLGVADLSRGGVDPEEVARCERVVAAAEAGEDLEEEETADAGDDAAADGNESDGDDTDGDEGEG